MKIHKEEDFGCYTYRIIQEGEHFRAQRLSFLWWRNLYREPAHSLSEAEKDLKNYQLDLAAGAY
jgi:hypothetical protein